MKTPNCKHFDFAYTTYEGEKRIYCALSGGSVRQGECAKCKSRERKETADTERSSK